MEKNEKLLQEAFFKKESYADKAKRKLAQYEPQSDETLDRPGFGSIMSNVENKGIVVNDFDEAKKRLTGAFGASIGINTVKNMASRSIKSFPIIISDNVLPETSVMLKRLMEEQYAEYINLLISNQVIDLSAYTSSEKGNIAIQALDVLTGPDFGKKAIAKKALSGELSAEDFFKNFSAYNLVRNESKEYKTGVPLIDALLEDAMIVKPEDAQVLTEYMQTFSSDIAEILTEVKERDDEEASKEDPQYVTFSNFLTNIESKKSDIETRKNVFDIARGYKAGYSSEQRRRIENKNEEISELDERLAELNAIELADRTASDKLKIKELTAKKTILTKELSDLKSEDNKSGSFERLTSSDIVVDKEELKKSLDNSLGELLLNPKNEAIKDRFEKATFLLQSNRISGGEWIEYVVQRLGIPVSRDTRARVVTQFKARDVIDPENVDRPVSKSDARRIATNQIITGKILKPWLSFSSLEVLKAAAAGTAVGIGTAFATGALGASTLTSAGSALTALIATVTPFAPLIAGAAIGGIALWNSIKKRLEIKKSRKERKLAGWERVEALIMAMEEQQRDVIRLAQGPAASKPDYEKELSPQFLAMSSSDKTKNVDDKKEEVLSGEELKKELEKYSEGMSTLLKSAKPVSKSFLPESMLVADFSKETLTEAQEIFDDVMKELNEDREYKALLNEGLFDFLKSKSRRSSIPVQTKIPVKITKMYEYDKKAKPEVLVAPMFSTRQAYAYGSVEYDKRELRDRKYNTPLVLTIKFKERYGDEKFADNELVAVIGILGVITRVPSEEMAYILKSNAEGDTIKSFLKLDGNPENMVSDLLGVTKIKKDVENLAQSSDVWQNLEKVSRLAVTNKLAGKTSDNVANAHLVFSQKEIDDVKAEISVDYLNKIDLVRDLMKRYSTFTVMVANDASTILYIYDDMDNISWQKVTYDAFRNKDTGEQLDAALLKLGRM